MQTDFNTYVKKVLKWIENLLLENLSEQKELETIYEDEALIVINKPAEFFICTWKGN